MRILHDNIWVKPIIKDKTASGIILADSQKNENFGKVKHLGMKVKFTKVGDTVKYYEHAGTPINYNGEDFLILRENADIIGIV